VQLPEAWIAVNGEIAAKLVAELHREMPVSHQLHGLHVRAVARRLDRDAVLYDSEDDAQVFLVHLTWSMQRDPAGPWTETYRDLDDFCDRSAAE
jgi:hypothetical protein